MAKQEDVGYESELLLRRGKPVRARETVSELLREFAGGGVLTVTLADGRQMAVAAQHIISITPRKPS